MNRTRPLVMLTFLLLGVALADVGMAYNCNVWNPFDHRGWRLFFIQLADAPEGSGPDDGQWPPELMVGLANSAEQLRLSYPLRRFEWTGDDFVEGETIAQLTPIELPQE